MDIKSLMNDSASTATQQPPPAPLPPPPSDDRVSLLGRSNSEISPVTGLPPQHYIDHRHLGPAFAPPAAPHLPRSSSLATSPTHAHQPHQVQQSPLRTPSHGPGQYFPPQYSSSASLDQYHAPDKQSPMPPNASASQSLASPFGHGVSLGYAHPAHPPPPQPSLGRTSSSISSQSPVPPVHDSPLAVRPTSQPPYGRSHPSTPLGPPQTYQVRPQTQHAPDGQKYLDRTRTFSGGSQGSAFGQQRSPVPNTQSLSQIVEGPNQHGVATSGLPRRNIDHLHHLERERSASISPRTHISRRNISGEHARAFSDMTMMQSPLQQDMPYTPEARPFAADRAPPSRSASHYSDASARADRPLSARPADHASIPSQSSSRQLSRDMNGQEHAQPNHDIYGGYDRGQETLLQQPLASSAQSLQPLPEMLVPKRKQSEMPPETPREAKKPRTQYLEPPPWARLHLSNPLYDEQIRKFPQLKDRPPPLTRSSAVAQKQAAPLPADAPAKSPVAGGASDDRKSRISAMLGMPWELSLSDIAPADKLLHSVAEFLFLTMLSRPELGAGDPRNGSLEIEAKIGTLIDRNLDRRLELPVMSPCVLAEQFSKARLRFESLMTERQHKSLNKHLNELVKQSMQPRRAPMQYRHRYERDSFASLTPAGIAALPPCAHAELARSRNESRRPHHVGLRTSVDIDPKLRATTPSPPVIAQIVKLRLADLDIFCPTDPFDVRISVNIEIDLHGQKGMDMASLTTTDANNDDRRDRFKNRLSYKHLAYSIDLTQVTYDDPTAPDTRDDKAKQEEPIKTHELEVEIDAALLRQQAERLQKGEENAFEALVEGLVNDVFLCVRVKAVDEDEDKGQAVPAAK